MMPWRPDEALTIYSDCELILDKVQPDVTVVDPLFSPGLTQCLDGRSRTELNWIVLAPNTIKDFATATTGSSDAMEVPSVSRVPSPSFDKENIS